MANKPAKPCKNNNGRCPGLVKDGVCNICGKSEVSLKRKRENENRPSPRELGYDYQWNKIRTIYINAHPLCEKCEDEGRVTMAIDVHHILPKRKGGSDADDNLMSVCRKCHARLEVETRRHMG